MVSQEPSLMHRTIGENIEYGSKNELDDEDLQKAARASDSLNFIEEMSDYRGGIGFDSMVGDRGVKLSGGQKQRLCIAVARMKDADIICFDEPTSGLDYQNMIAVSNLLLKLSQRGKTLFVVTHDYEFLMSTCTHVMNLEKGSIRDYYAVTKDSAHKVYETMFLG